MKEKLLILILSVFFGCSKSDPSTSTPLAPTGCVKMGAHCKDGTTSTATGSGACSSHGGVSSWICQ